MLEAALDVGTFIFSVIAVSLFITVGISWGVSFFFGRPLDSGGKVFIFVPMVLLSIVICVVTIDLANTQQVERECSYTTYK